MKKFYVCKENDNVFYIEAETLKEVKKQISDSTIILKEELTVADAEETIDWYDDMISG